MGVAGAETWDRRTGAEKNEQCAWGSCQLEAGAQRWPREAPLLWKRRLSSGVSLRLMPWPLLATEINLGWCFFRWATCSGLGDHVGREQGQVWQACSMAEKLCGPWRPPAPAGEPPLGLKRGWGLDGLFPQRSEPGFWMFSACCHD